MALTDAQIAHIRAEYRAVVANTTNGGSAEDFATLATWLIPALDEIERLRRKYGALEAMPWLGRVTAVGGEPRPNEFVARIRYRDAALDARVVSKPSDDTTARDVDS